MAQAKRASEQQQQEQQPRKSKKPRTNRKLKGRKSEDGEQQQDEGEQALGATSLLAQHAKAHAKDETELELEEAVFGRRAGTRDADVYDGSLAANDLKRRAAAAAGADSDDEIDYEQDDLDEEDDEETGLERLRDDNVCFDLLPLSDGDSFRLTCSRPRSSSLSTCRRLLLLRPRSTASSTKAPTPNSARKAARKTKTI